MAAVAVLALAAPLLAGCGASATHVRDICRDVSSGTAALAPVDPTRPVTALQYALGRFALVEKAVSTAREASLPAADAGTLRRAWLDPAVASLAGWPIRLESLRVAAGADDRARVATTLRAALAVGTEGVDRGALGRAGYGVCATAFTPPVPAGVGAPGA